MEYKDRFEQKRLTVNLYKCHKCGGDIDIENHVFCIHEDDGIRITKRSLSDYSGDGKNKMTKYEVEESISIKDGAYTGEIVKEEIRKTMYQGKEIVYQDFTVSLDGLKNKKGEPITLTFGFSAFVSDKSQLGQFLTKMGLSVMTGKNVDSAQVIGKKISFLVTNTTGQKGTYAEIIKDKIKLV